jgi:photosystem II stability/assembly factor-like uncharacterized protein
MKRLFYLFLLIPITLFAKEPEVYFSVVGRKILTVIGNDIYVNGLYIGDGINNRWNRCGWKNNAINSIEIEPLSDGKVIYTACNNGVMRSNDSGKNWKILTDWDVTEVLCVKLDPQNNKIIYAATAFGVWKSTDGGNSWNKKNNGLQPVNQTFISSLEILKNNKLLAASADGVLVSLDGGNSWSQSGLKGKEIHEIEKAPYDDNILSCVTEDHGVYLSSDQGKTWKQINWGLKTMTFYTVAFDPKNKGVMYCGGYKTGVYKTSNFGEKWIQLQNDITDKDVKVIAIYNENPEIIYSGLTNYGLYKSTDGGNNFIITGEPDGRIGSLLIR